MIDKSLREQYNAQAKQLGVLPIKVTPHYQHLVEEELTTLGQTGGPLYRVAYPTAARLEIRATHEVPDFVEDRTNMPTGLEGVLIHKYHQRALFLVTDKCAGHCMYCFRQDVMSDLQNQTLPTKEERLNRVIDYLVKQPQISELILSGGDPLNVSFPHLELILQRVRNETSVTDLRFHTRNIVFAPQVLSAKVCALLGEARARIYLHIVHPYELTWEVSEAIKRLQTHGVRTYSQFPILRGINDHLAVLTKLLRALDDLRANPINVFIPDPISYSAAFRLPLKRLLGLMDELYWTTSSWTNGVRLVLDTPIGKVRRDDISAWDEQTGQVTFQREGKSVIYHNFPAALDEPSQVETLLWKR